MTVAENLNLGKKEGYQVKLPNFEGPLDLLLYLIKKEEIDIYDIPIAIITRQYLEYIELMRELDLEVAGEFILMAATLIRIKVKMLLPGNTEEEEIEEDPRAELVRQILEYKRFKEVAESLTDRETEQRRLFPRSYFEWEKKYEKKEVVLKDATMFDLLTAFKYALDHIPKTTVHKIGPTGPTIENQIQFLLKLLEKKDHICFRELISELKERITIVVTFVAILELIRTHRILVQQVSIFGEIWISRKAA